MWKSFQKMQSNLHNIWFIFTELGQKKIFFSVSLWKLIMPYQQSKATDPFWKDKSDFLTFKLESWLGCNYKWMSSILAKVRNMYTVERDHCVCMKGTAFPYFHKMSVTWENEWLWSFHQLLHREENIPVR